MGSEISFQARDVDIDVLAAALRELASAEPGLEVTITELPFSGRACTVWGRKLDDGDESVWAEAHMEADVGDSTIETIRPANGATPFTAAVIVGNYSDRALAALQATGRPSFDYATTFVEIDVRWEASELSLSFDRATRATGGLSRFSVAHIDPDSTLLSDRDGWFTLRGTAADHMGVIYLLDLLRKHATVVVHDSTGYDDHRDETALVAAMAFDRQMRADLRAALDELPHDVPRAFARRHEPVLTIDRLLNGRDGGPIEP